MRYCLFCSVRLFALVFVLAGVFRQGERWSALARLLLRILLLIAALLSSRTAILIGVLLLLRLLLLLVLLLRLRLRRHDSVVVLGVLQIILRHHAVAGGIGVTRELKVFLVHIRGRTTDFDLRSGRIEGAVRIVSATATIVVVAAACVLRPTAASARTLHLVPYSRTSSPTARCDFRAP